MHWMVKGLILRISSPHSNKVVNPGRAGCLKLPCSRCVQVLPLTSGMTGCSIALRLTCDPVKHTRGTRKTFFLDRYIPFEVSAGAYSSCIWTQEGYLPKAHCTAPYYRKDLLSFVLNREPSEDYCPWMDIILNPFCSTVTTLNVCI